MFQQDQRSICYAEVTGQQVSTECTPLASHAGLDSPTQDSSLQGLTLQHVCSSFNIHLPCFQEAKHGMFLAVEGLRSTKGVKVLKQQTMHMALILTSTMSDLGSTVPRFSSSICRGTAQSILGPSLTLCSGAVPTAEICVSVSCSACVKAPSESDLQFANGLHIAFQVGSWHFTESTVGSHFSERLKTFGSASRGHSASLCNFHQRKAI